LGKTSLDEAESRMGLLKDGSRVRLRHEAHGDQKALKKGS